EKRCLDGTGGGGLASLSRAQGRQVLLPGARMAPTHTGRDGRMWRARPPRRCAVAESTPHQTPATTPSLTAPDLLARRGWSRAAPAFGAALLTKFGWPDRAEAVNPPLLLNQDNPATAKTSLSGAVSDTLLEIDQPDGAKSALSILG